MFTDRPLAGNPLAVFPEADGLSDAEMQAIASELHLSETTFVLPPTEAGSARGAAYRMRIFTPALELPVAGHPSIGTCWVLADEGTVALSGPITEVRQEVAIGVLPLRVASVANGAGGLGPGDITMVQDHPEIGEEIPPDELDILGPALEVAPRYLGWRDADGRVTKVSEARPTVVSCGLPFLVVPFRDIAMLSDLDTDRADEVGRIAGEYGCDSAALIAAGNSGAIPDATVHARIFTDPRRGISEDPATGSAAGPIAVYLGRLAGCRSEIYRVVIEQGIEIGRPSRLVAEVDFDDSGWPTAARVSGSTVAVIEGWLELPDIDAGGSAARADAATEHG